MPINYQNEAPVQRHEEPVIQQKPPQQKPTPVATENPFDDPFGLDLAPLSISSTNTPKQPTNDAFDSFFDSQPAVQSTPKQSPAQQVDPFGDLLGFSNYSTPTTSQPSSTNSSLKKSNNFFDDDPF
jgi:hypothetical protein